ncbi:MAG: four helix bundle protein [bacterium]
MRQENIIQDKSYAFAVRVVRLSKYLIEEKKEYVFSKQIARSGTSIGSNVEEAIGGQTEKDFYSKLTISYKEVRETRFWLRLLRDTDYLDAQLAESLLNDCDELLKILGAITRTLKKKIFDS